MTKIRKREFAVCLFCMKKPKPWRRYPPNIPGSLHGAVRYAKCLNAYSLIFPNKPSIQQSQKKRKKRVTFPFLKRNLEKSVETWDLYEARYKEWKSEHHQSFITSSSPASPTKKLRAKRVIQEVNEQSQSTISSLVTIQRGEDSLNSSRSGRIIETRLQTRQRARASYSVNGSPIAAYSDTTEAGDTPIPFKKRTAYRIIHSVARPARNKRAQLQKCKIEQFNSSSPISSVNTVAKIAETKFEPQKRKRWTANETEQLKIALKLVVNPKTDEDWDAVSVFLNGGHRTGSECREQAIRIKWKPPKNLDDSPTVDQNRDASPLRLSSNEIDFFSSNLNQSGEKGKNTSLLNLNPDDSLLKLISTPPDEPRFARKPFILRQVLNETAHCSHDNSSFLDV